MYLFTFIQFIFFGIRALIFSTPFISFLCKTKVIFRQLPEFEKDFDIRIFNGTFFSYAIIKGRKA